jgi:hypothetical protein
VIEEKRSCNDRPLLSQRRPVQVAVILATVIVAGLKQKLKAKLFEVSKNDLGKEWP